MEEALRLARVNDGVVKIASVGAVRDGLTLRSPRDGWFNLQNSVRRLGIAQVTFSVQVVVVVLELCVDAQATKTRHRRSRLVVPSTVQGSDVRARQSGLILVAFVQVHLRDIENVLERELDIFAICKGEIVVTRTGSANVRFGVLPGHGVLLGQRLVLVRDADARQV